MAKFDKDLIFLYSENARIKIKDLAKLLNKSTQRLKYSLGILEKEGIVHHAHCIFDYSFFGLILFRVYFKGGYISEKDRANIIKKLSENPYVMSICELSGEFDLAIEITSPNPSRFNKELQKIVNNIPTLNNYKVILNLVTHLYPRIYLIKKSDLLSTARPDMVVGGDRTIELFDNHQMDIMGSLLFHPKIRMTQLAKEAQINVKTASLVLKRLKEGKMVKGFKYVLNTNKLGILKHRLFLKLHNLSQEAENKLMEHIMNTKEIIQVNKTVGDWDMEVDIESPDKIKIRYIIIQMREEFKELIETFNIIEFYQYYKKSYLPPYLFNPNFQKH